MNKLKKYTSIMEWVIKWVISGLYIVNRIYHMA